MTVHDIDSEPRTCRRFHYGPRVDATGTQRRLQALMVLGWSQKKLAHYLHLPQQHMSKMLTATQVNGSTAQAVSELYDRLWNLTPPQATRHDKSAASRARIYATARGWLPPMAWDDATIDDPNVGPGAEVNCDDQVDDIAVEMAMRGHLVSKELRPIDRDSTIRALHARGLSITAIARRLETAHHVIQKALHANGETA